MFGLQLTFHIHTLMQDSGDSNCRALNTIEDEMLPNGMAEVSFSDMVTISADADILRNQLEGLIQPQEIFLALFNAPSRLRIVGDIPEVNIRLVGKLK